jgi:DNA-binding MarR family transcriptional regulator
MDDALILPYGGRPAAELPQPAMPHRRALPANGAMSADDAANAADERRNWYLAYTQWRIGHLRHASATFFRNSPHRSLIWFMVMRGHYEGAPPSLQDCIAAGSCSTGTARGIITTAEAKGYFRFVSDPDDSRKRRVAPTALCVAEYQEMVGIFLRLADLLDHRDLDSMVGHVSATVLRTPQADLAKWYRAYAQWRVASHRAAPKRKSVRFFRQSRPHTTIWMAVMESHYAGRPVALNECIRNVKCSKDTARKIINAAIHSGYFILAAADDDSRKKLVRPSAPCVADYQAMVDILLRLADVLQPRVD